MTYAGLLSFGTIVAGVMRNNSTGLESFEMGKMNSPTASLKSEAIWLIEIVGAIDSAAASAPSLPLFDSYTTSIKLKTNFL